MQTKFLAAIACTAVLSACATNAVGLFKDFKVNGQTVTAAYQQGLYDDQIAAGQKDSTQLREAVKALAVERFAVQQEAEKTGIASDPAVQRRIEAARIQILAQAISTDYLKKSPLSEAQILATYKQAQKEYGNNEYHVRQMITKLMPMFSKQSWPSARHLLLNSQRLPTTTKHWHNAAATWDGYPRLYSRIPLSRLLS